jgi:hypothetical protein
MTFGNITISFGWAARNRAGVLWTKAAASYSARTFTRCLTAETFHE